MDATTRRKLRRSARIFIFSKWLNEEPVIDDMQGLFSHASDAYRAGKREGRDELFRSAMQMLSGISSKYETIGHVKSFEVAEECCRALQHMKARLDAPEHEIG
jgi:hypothetical protein